ncbi:GFA family protein [Sphingomonas hankyongi]|uniref:GFA family protein n=1 Tax=Sphingomonas hankyongi TaxID=2908209 RepID=A0ABT0S014_9SPHN|nr:GFA family protein [Sphingomonas hankyongi]
MTNPNSPGAVASAKPHEGGCLCGDVRYTTSAEPVRVTVCYCTFCQRLTGSAYLVEPIFRREDMEVRGAPKAYERRSDGSGKIVKVHFCGRCGTSLYLSFERFPDFLGLLGGTFDDPNWFDRGPGKSRHIFTRHAQAGVILPPGVEIYLDHALQLDGAPNAPSILREPRMVKRPLSTDR